MQLDDSSQEHLLATRRRPPQEAQAPQPEQPPEQQQEQQQPSPRDAPVAAPTPTLPPSATLLSWRAKPSKSATASSGGAGGSTAGPGLISGNAAPAFTTSTSSGAPLGLGGVDAAAAAAMPTINANGPGAVAGSAIPGQGFELRNREEEWLIETLRGIDNFGNTCYANSIVQALYGCQPFRDSILHYKLPKDLVAEEQEEQEVGVGHAEAEQETQVDAGLANSVASLRLDATGARPGISPQQQESLKNSAPSTPSKGFFNFGSKKSDAAKSPAAAASPGLTHGAPAASAAGASVSAEEEERLLQQQSQQHMQSSTLFEAMRELFAMMAAAQHPGSPSSYAAGNSALTALSGRNIGAGAGGGPAAKRILPGGRGGAGSAAAAAANAAAPGLNGSAGGAGGAAALPIQSVIANPSTSLANALNLHLHQGLTAVSSTAIDQTTVRNFLAVLKRENILFDTNMHQDAHEMLNFVLNKVTEDIMRLDFEGKQQQQLKGGSAAAAEQEKSQQGVMTVNTIEPGEKTCVHRLFEGVLTNETRCLTCETVSRS